MEQHVGILGVLFIVFGILGLVIGAGLFLLIAGAGAMSGDQNAMLATGAIATIIAAVLALLSIPSIIAGVGLRNHRNWARILALVIAAINIFNFPFGTALGIYTFWVLLNEQGARLFERRPVSTPYSA